MLCAAVQAGIKPGKLDLKSVREELRTATEYMAAAAQRVEQVSWLPRLI